MTGWWFKLTDQLDAIDGSTEYAVTDGKRALFITIMNDAQAKLSDWLDRTDSLPAPDWLSKLIDRKWTTSGIAGLPTEQLIITMMDLRQAEVVREFD